MYILPDKIISKTINFTYLAQADLFRTMMRTLLENQSGLGRLRRGKKIINYLGGIFHRAWKKFISSLFLLL